jgi:hypothetical protein
MRIAEAGSKCTEVCLHACNIYHYHYLSNWHILRVSFYPAGYELAKIHHIRVTVQYASRQRLVVVIKKQYTRMSNVRLDLIGKTSTKN